MPLPIIGAAFLGGLFTKVVDVIVDLFTKRLAVHALIIAGALAAYGTFAALIDGLFAGLGSLEPSGIVATGIGLFPSNTDDCVAAIIAAKGAQLVHAVQQRVFDLRRA